MPLNTTTLEDFFSGAPFKASLEVGNPTLHLHNWAYGLFFQDDWRVARNFTVNLGVRYEFSSVPGEDHNLLGNFDPNFGLVQVQTGTNAISSLYKPDHKNFSPHVGFAWDTTGTGKTVLRGGVGLTYETVNWQSFIAFNNAFGPGSVPTGESFVARHHQHRKHYCVPEFPLGQGPVYGNTTTIDCNRQSLPDHERGP